jgi:hypothetical protein
VLKPSCWRSTFATPLTRQAAPRSCCGC